jgi:hypothetical protein
MRRVVTAGALAVMLVGGMSIPAEAVAITSAGSIVVGDKTFSNFTCNVVIAGTATPTDCSAIDVTGSIDQFGNVGLRFQTGANVNTSGSTIDILIGYDATVTSGSQLISDVHLVFNGSVTGTGFTNVTETVVGLIPVSIGVIGQVSVQNPPPTFSANIDLSQLSSSVRVTKDVFLGAGTSGSATVSFVDQFLSQTPEPGSLALLGTAFFGFGAALRRRLKGVA